MSHKLNSAIANHAVAEVVTPVTTPMCKNAAVHHSKNCALMSQMGHERRIGAVRNISALPPRADVAVDILMPNGMIFMPRASLAWQPAFGTVTPSALLTFQNTGVPFGILGAPIARDAALVEAGGDLQLGPQTKVGIAYFGQLATNARDHSVKANFSWRF